MKEKEAIELLKEYNEQDILYQGYLNGSKNAIQSDFDKFCVKHCISIDVVLKALEEKDKEIKELKLREEKVKGYLENLKNYERFERKYSKLSRKIMLIEEGLTTSYKICRIANNILWFYKDSNYRKDLFKTKENKEC